MNKTKYKILKNIDKASVLYRELRFDFPQTNDLFLVKLAKCAGIINTLFSGPANSYNNTFLCRKYGLKENLNPIMVEFITHPLMLSHFQKDEVPEQHGSHTATHFYSDTIGHVIAYRQHNRYQDLYMISNNFNYGLFREAFWSCFNNKINLYFGKDATALGSRLSCDISELKSNTPLYGDLNILLDDTLKIHKKAALKNYSRSYLLLGKPGTGKSSFCLDFANRINGRVLKFTSELLTNPISDIMKLIDILEPDVVIIDDVDRIKDTSDRLLSLIELIKQNKKTTILMTANYTELIDEALLRPGRIDKIIKVDLPSKEDRYEILKQYSVEYNAGLNEEQINNLSESSEGLSAAFLKEIITHISCSSYKEGVERLNEVIAFGKNNKCRNPNQSKD